MKWENVDLILACIVASGIIIIIIWAVYSVNQSMEDRLVTECISSGDIFTSPLQQKFCLDIMEGLDYHLEEGYRRNLYETLKKFQEKQQ